VEVSLSGCMLCGSGACGSVVVDSNSCMYANDDAGHPFDRYVGKHEDSYIRPIPELSIGCVDPWVGLGWVGSGRVTQNGPMDNSDPFFVRRYAVDDACWFS